jgi:hypothetical protein
MSVTLHPYLHFNGGKATEAMEFYNQTPELRGPASVVGTGLHAGFFQDGCPA